MQFSSIPRFICHVYCQTLNSKTLARLVLNIFLNFLPVLIWLSIFKNASLIPTSMRPRIHVKLAYLLDDFVFNCEANRAAALFSGLSISVLSYLVYKWCYSLPKNNLVIPQFNRFGNFIPRTSNFDNSSNYIDLENFDAGGDVNFELDSNSDSISNSSNGDEIIEITEFENNKFLSKRNYYLSPNCFVCVPALLIVLAWPILNSLHLFIDIQTHFLDLLSFFSYVLLHITIPILTSVYFYCFSIPGVLKYFSFCLGLQNIFGVFTHLLLPTAPPWFIHLNGLNATANYDTLGYAAGLTRIDSSLGTHLATNGFHKSPIVFGALPSLHSAMAVQCFLFISWFSKSITLKVFYAGYILLQWWSTMYLDHHWRIDLLVGCYYALISFTVFNVWKFNNLEFNAIFKRIYGENEKLGWSFGMRFFDGYCNSLKNWFDPYLKE